MLFSIDGGATWNKAEGIRVRVENVDPESIDALSANFNFTHEGLITDIESRHNNVGTQSETFVEIVERLTEDS